MSATSDHETPAHDTAPDTAEDAASRDERPTEDSVLGGDLVHPVGSGVGSGEQDYVATNGGGVSAEDGNPLPEDEQGRGSEYDPATQGPQQEG